MRGARSFRLACIAVIGIACLGAYTEDVSRGDLAWQRRAEGATDGVPLREPIRAAVSAYESALGARPENLEAHWKLLRALYFAGYFAEREDPGQRRETYERGLEVSENGLELLAARTQQGQRFDELDVATLRSRLAEADVSQTDVARLYFWSAISWGVWARDVGLLSAVYEGAANRLHRYTLIAIELEPDYFDGGAFRLLGRLHAELPRVPFVSGWVDREQAIPLVERAVAIGPDEPGNRMLLGLTLLDLAPERRDEGLALLEQVEDLTPRSESAIEDFAVFKEARQRLIEERAAERS